MPMWIFAIALVALGLVAVAVVAVTGSLSSAKQTAPSLPDPRLAEADRFIEHLREVAWEHRDVSPELSTIIIDEISKRHRPLPPPD